MRIRDKVWNFISLYRLPNQSLEEIETFTDKLELNNPFLIAFLGENKKWYENNNTAYEGTKTDGITSQFVMQQLINEPTHIIPSSCCIDLVCFQESIHFSIKSSIVR